MLTAEKNSAYFNKGVIIPSLYFILLLFFAHRHTLFTEWDGAMQYLSSMEINAGKGYHGMSAHFWPPLYTVLIAIFTHVFNDGFTAAKLISVFSSSLLLWVIYCISLPVRKLRPSLVSYLWQ